MAIAHKVARHSPDARRACCYHTQSSCLTLQGRRPLQCLQAFSAALAALVVPSPECPQVGIGGTLALAGTDNPDVAWIGENAAWIALFFMCFYICAYAWSWGPLPWLYAAEVQFLETRSAGQSIATLINLLFSFVIGQVSADRLEICVCCPSLCDTLSLVE